MLRNNPEKVNVRIVGADTDPETAERAAVDAFHPIPRSDSSDFCGAIAQICEREKVDVIAIQHDTDALALARLPPSRGRLLVSEEKVLLAASDKAVLYSRLEALGIPIPRWRAIDSPPQLREAAIALGYPHRELAIKPARFSCGSRGFYLLTEKPLTFQQLFEDFPPPRKLSLSALEAVFSERTEIPKFVLTEYLPGAEYSIDGFRGAASCVAIPRLRQQLAGGTAMKTALAAREDLVEYTVRAAAALDLRFLFGMQYRLNEEGIPHLLECNPRIQGTLIASHFSGVNLIWLAVCEALGRPHPPLPKPLLTGTYSRRWSGVAHGPHGHTFV
jgi:carbamoyl-phosphate synthase large subunit